MKGSVVERNVEVSILPVVLCCIMYVAFAVGVFFCCLNFYLSFLRYPVCKWLGYEYKWVSGAPLIGSLLVVMVLPGMREVPFIFWLGVVAAILDTGGFHWFVASQLWMTAFPREEP
jgi:hypothetical protein